MASSAAHPHRGTSQRPSAPLPSSNQPAGTFFPGTKVQVGSHRVTIERYLSEGGFAHVYVVRVPRDNNKHEIAVLKRVAVPDREHLASMRTEVETMKKLKGHKHVVTYMDSHASQLKGGGYEVFLLMEFCSGGGLIDFMNTRLQHRLTEPEILKIFSDVSEGLACMHYLKPPLLHRDLKVENVLIAKANSGHTTYKLCDFGSAAVPRPAAKTPEEGRLIEEDVQQHTTMQYRSPEMIDVWRKQPINEKADIWALGVFLYKLCYYTTPFEDVGQMAILNASYKFPAYPIFSDRLKRFIASMLKEDPHQRPNVYEVIKEVCSMRGTEVPVKDIYANRTQSEARRNESLPSPDPPISPPVGLQKGTPEVQVQAIPDIAPMRRGRPSAPSQQAAVQSKPSPSPANGDPFAALDSKNYDVRAGAVDELSKRFPSLNEFSITHDKGGYPFAKSGGTAPAVDAAGKSNLSERVTQALADEVFAHTKTTAGPVPSQAEEQLKEQRAALSKPKAPADHREVLSNSPLVHQPTPVRPGTTYTSRGVGSSPPPVKPKLPQLSNRPIWRVPDTNTRSSSQPRASVDAEKAAAMVQPSRPPAERPALLDLHRSKSQTASNVSAKSPTSSRPSLEGHRPTNLDVGEPAISRARSAQNRSRPSSMYVSSNMDFLRDHEVSSKRIISDHKWNSRQPSPDPRTSVDEPRIRDDMDFLRNSEDSERTKANRNVFGHKKKGSLGNALGRFGDAFKRSGRDSDSKDQGDAVLLTPDPEMADLRRLELPPAEPAEEYTAEALDLETEELPPDVKRELERRRFSEEERRVADAAAQHRARAMQSGGAGPVPTRASTIQKRVQSLLEEGRQSPVKKTAEGYGRYTAPVEEPPTPADMKAAPPPVARKPPTMEASNNPYPRTRPLPPQTTAPSVIPSSLSPTVASLPTNQPRVVSRPSVPPKSSALRTGGSKWSPTPTTATTAATTSPQLHDDRPLPPLPPSTTSGGRPTGLAALLAKDLEGVPDYPPRGSSLEDAPQPPTFSASGQTTNDPELDFEKRYPSLAGIEMVETDIAGREAAEQRRKMTVRDV